MPGKSTFVVQTQYTVEASELGVVINADEVYRVDHKCMAFNSTHLNAMQFKRIHVQ